MMFARPPEGMSIPSVRAGTPTALDLYRKRTVG